MKTEIEKALFALCEPIPEPGPSAPTDLAWYVGMYVKTDSRFFTQKKAQA